MPNVNDNGGARPWIYNTRGDGKINEEMARHVPAATKLIERYCQHEWKNNPASAHYMGCEYTICLQLKHIEGLGRDAVIGGVSLILGVNPLLLHNDPDLPF